MVRIPSGVALAGLLLGIAVLAGSNAAAAGGITVSINAPAKVVRGCSFAVSVDINGVTAFDSGQFDISFDESLVQLDNITAGQIGATQIPVDLWNRIGTGTYRIIVNVPGVPGISGSGSLVVLQFHATSSAVGTGAVNLSNGFLSDNLGTEISATWIGDSVGVVENPVVTAPSVTTNAATNLGTASATLNGNLSLLGSANSVNVSFEWGLSTSYGNVSRAEARTATGIFSANLTGLITSTTYHFRAKAVGDGFAVYGEDIAFTTASPYDTTAPGIITQQPTIRHAGVIITWTTNEPATSQVKYGLTEEYGSASPLDGNLFNSHSVSLTGLKAGKTYHYQVKSKDAANNEAVSADHTFTTTAPSEGGIPTWAWALLGLAAAWEFTVVLGLVVAASHSRGRILIPWKATSAGTPTQQSATP